MSSVKTTIRVLHQNHIAMGPGKADLLEAILQQGSISAAAKSMKMSYKRAWDLVIIMNTSFQSPLVTTAIGGAHGGGATLTELGQEVLRLYRDVQVKAARYVEEEAQGLAVLLAQTQ
jgi:molybdate transport system regulatory protein